MFSKPIASLSSLPCTTKLFEHVPISNLRAEHDKSLSMPVYQPADHGFMEMVHVALKLRSDIMAQPGYDRFNIG
jgi:hypothetical protein